MKMDMNEPSWAKVAGERRKRIEPKEKTDGDNEEEKEPELRETRAQEIFNDPQKLMHFTAMARVMLDDPAYSVAGAGGIAGPF